MSIKEEIRSKTKGMGADLVGFLNLRDYNSPRSPDPKKYLPSAKSIIVLGFRPLSGAYETGSWVRMHSYLYCPEIASQYCIYLLSKYLEDQHKAKVLVIPGHRPFELTEETLRAPIGIVSLRHAAVQSGLAVWGRNTLALTPEFGAKVFFTGLLTSLDLETDPPLDKNYDPCSKCSFPCREACPGNAFTEDGKVLHHRCVRWSQKHDPGGLMRFFIEMADKPTMEERKAMLRSACFFNLMQFLQGYIYYECMECTKMCPTFKELN